MIVGLGPHQRRINVLETISQMLIDRGYNIKGFIRGDKIKHYEDHESYSMENIKHRMKKHIPQESEDFTVAIEAEYTPDPDSLKPVHVSEPKGRKIVVFLSCEHSKLGKGPMLGMIEYCRENDIHQMILPLCLGYTSYAYKEMETVRMDESVFIELFSYDELQRRVAQQELVPKYQLLRRDEVDRVLKRYGCSSIYRLPRIGEADMASRYFGFKKGDVVEERTTIGGCQTPIGYYVIVRL